MDARIRQRRHAVREAERRRRLRRTVSVLVVLVLVGALVALERSPLVAVERVEVAGAQRLDPATVAAAAEVPLGTSTVRLQLPAIETRVAALPLVRDATVRRADPLTVRIEVVEREPVLVARGADGPVLVDRDGIVIAEGSQAGLPEVVLFGAAPSVGADVTGIAALANAHAVWQGLSGPLRADVHRYLASGADELSLELRDGTRVRFGRAERMEEKIRALGVVLEDLDGVEVALIDVRAPRAPVVVAP